MTIIKINRHKLLETSLSKYPAKAGNILKTILFSESFSGILLEKDVKELINILECSENELMISLCDIAKCYANPPISNFYVGTISKGLSGNLYFGANMEFPRQTLNFSIHSEQSSVINAWNHGEQGIASLAVNEPPCGMCRQFLNEITTANKLKIYLPNKTSKLLKDYLPNSFGPKDLKVTDMLMEKADHHLRLVNSSNDAAVLKALNAANKSYAPYTKAYSGAAILTADNKIYSAAYAENAAFNPSLSPMSAALISLNFSDEDYKNKIKKVVLVEIKDSLISQVDNERSLLKSITENVQLQIEYAAIESK